MKKRKKQDFALNYGCRTDIGCVREHNEDSLYANAPLFAVADGMGGHAAGEVASEIAIESLSRHAPQNADAGLLSNAVEVANHDVIRGAMEGRGKKGMGTTLTAAVIDGDELVIAQVGDSRAYLLHNGKLQQITRDHSLMADLIEQGQITPAEARVHPNRSLITRALGSDPDMFADRYKLIVEPGDRLLLCSDGLCGMLLDAEIEKTLQKVSEPQACADKLVNQAIDNGGLDNITVIVVDISGHNSKKVRKKVRKSRALIITIIVLALGIIIGAGALGFYLVKNSAYLANDGGYVAVYDGVPGNLFGVEFSHLAYKTDIKVEDLNESIKDRLSSGIIKVDNKEAADEIVEQYRNDVKEKQALKSGSNSLDKSQSDSKGSASNKSTSGSQPQNNNRSNNTSNTQSNQ